MGRDSARTPQPKLLLGEDDLTDNKDLFKPEEATTEALLSYHFWRGGGECWQWGPGNL